ncbi:hypothetical protein SLEP1_g57337 [Rubroshorea leprosula]|uniref:Uncharacterized protein n=1 Tax=Rubroshorea leprosula TaxID=152421 RepID=A0AAV5MPH0_9ROSI|nr:hypothetical protein SLEP1_g57337 [Rubroshorea leprosula]
MIHGLHPLCGDVEVIGVAKILIQSSICYVYVEHGQLNVDEEVAIGVGKLLLHPEVLGNDTNDDELLVGNNKVRNLMGDMDSTDTLSHGRKTNDKGKEKATKACRQQKSERNGGVMASSSLKGIIIKELVDFEGFRLVDNSNIEYSDIEYGSSSTYIDSDDAESYYSDSIKDLNVKDNALRRASSSLHYDPNYDYPHFEVGMAFENAIQFKKAIVKYSIRKGCQPHWKKNEPGRQRIACDIKHGCFNNCNDIWNAFML